MMRTSWTPGRVNLMGEWIDFNGGWVLPAALPLGVHVRLEENGLDEDRVRSQQFAGEARASLSDPAKRHWADYAFGALQAARAEGWVKAGCDIQLESDVPAGAGVSSSAAVTVGVLRAAAPETVDSTTIARLAQKVEHDFIGVPCGIMDQMAVAHAQPGQAIALDTRTLSYNAIDLPTDWRFAVIHSGVERKLADGRYKQRRNDCMNAAQVLDVEHLCDAQHIETLPAALLPIARHVVSENERTKAAVDALKNSDGHTLGALMTATHVSLQDDFQVSTPEVDALVESVLEFGALGARITGAGFGGCIVALIDADTPEDWHRALNSKHPKARFICDVTSDAKTRKAM